MSRARGRCSASICACGHGAKRTAGGKLRCARVLFHCPGARVGTLRVDQGARRGGRRCASDANTDRNRAAVRVSGSISTTGRSTQSGNCTRKSGKRSTRRDFADHVKLGPGGIREIEFIAQAFQLIRGGRDPSLRATRDARTCSRRSRRSGCSTKRKSRSSPPPTSSCAGSSIDCSISMTSRRHTLPESDPDRQTIAAAMGYADWHAFSAALEAHRIAVTRHFENVFAAAEEELPAAASIWLGATDDEAAETALIAQGYSAPKETLARLRQIRASSRYQQLPAASRERLDLLLPRLVEACARARPVDVDARAGAASPDVALARCLDFVEAISRRAAYLAMLAEEPHALTKSGRDAGELEVGGRVLDPASDPARRAARPARATRGARLERIHCGAAERDGRRRRRAPDGRDARAAPRAGVSAAHAGSRRRAVGRAARGSSLARGGSDPAGDDRGVLAVLAEASHGDAALRDHRLRQARRKGAWLCVRPRSRVPLRRSARGRGGKLRAARAAHQHLAIEPHLRWIALRDRPRIAPERRRGIAGVFGGRISPLSARVGVDLGASGADSCALLRRRRGDRGRLRSVPARSPDGEARFRQASLRDPCRCGSGCSTRIRTRAVSSI